MRLNDIRPSILKLPLKHPGTGEYAGITLDIIGKDSGPYKKLMKEFLQDKEQKAKAGTTITMDEALTFARKLICTHVIGWDDPDEPYTPDKLDTLLKSGEYDWVVEQINELLENREDFFKGSLSSSVSA